MKELQRALHGVIGPHQRMMLAEQWRHVEYLDEAIARLDQEIEERTRPFEEALELLDTIPGVGRQSAEQILAEIGTDMSRFASASHLASWAGMAPGNYESAGKRLSSRTRKGNKKLRACLVECARAAARKKDTYLSAKYHRIAARRGANRASMAVGRTILEIIYYLLTRKEPYKELGADYWDRQREAKIVRQTVKKLEGLGYEVKLEKWVHKGIKPYINFNTFLWKLYSKG